MQNTGKALEPWLLLAKSTRGQASAKIVEDVLNAADTFAFNELLQMDSIKEMKQNPQLLPFYKKLEIFAYGTFQDYQEQQQQLPPLTPEQLQKLRMLTLVTLAGTQRTLSYETLLSALGINHVRQLEDLVIDAIYSDVLKAKLDQKKRVVEVESAIGRDVDVHGGGVDRMLKELEEWSSTCTNLLSTLETLIRTTTTQESQHKTQHTQYLAELEKAKEAVKKMGPIQPGHNMEDDEAFGQGTPFGSSSHAGAMRSSMRKKQAIGRKGIGMTGMDSGRRR